MNTKILILIISFSAGYSSLYEMKFCDTKSYQNFTKFLCATNSTNKIYPPLVLQHDCIRNVITVGAAGRLGNNLFEYVVLWIESRRRNEWKPYLPLCAYERLSQVFEMAIPSMNQIQHCYNHCKFDDNHYEIIARRKVAVLRDYNNYFYLQIIHEILKSREIFKKLFVFKESLIRNSQGMLHKAVKLNKINAGVGEASQNEFTFVGIHVRRTDNAHYANMEYYKAAIEHFEVRYKNLIFVVATDNNSWTRQHLLPIRKNIYLSVMLFKENSPGLDLALLASCNHSILTDGTFGFWGAYLAGGEVVGLNVTAESWIFSNLMENLYIGNNGSRILKPGNVSNNKFSEISKKISSINYDKDRFYLYLNQYQLKKRFI